MLLLNHFATNRKYFLAHRIKISEILPWNILPMLSFPGRQVMSPF